MERYYVKVTYSSGEVKVETVSRTLYSALTENIQDWSRQVVINRWLSRRFGKEWTQVETVPQCV